MLVLRVWREEDETLRARITHTLDLLSETQTSSAVVGVDDICQAVRSWLEVVARGDDSVTDR
jgi:hypothetical protein